MIRNFFSLIRNRGLHVIADATDNSITFSRRLLKIMDVMKLDTAKIGVFSIATLPSSYCFVVNPLVDESTPLADIQYNNKYDCVGFECLIPTVNRIFYDYGLPADSRCKLNVKVYKTKNKTTYYEICRPDGKHTR